MCDSPSSLRLPKFLPYLLTTATAVLPLSGAPDTVDSGFAAAAGQVFDATEHGGIASVLVQPDGKILFGSNEMPGTVGGNPLALPLIRFNPDGSVDNTFHADNDPNGAGTGIYYDGQGWSEVHALGLQSDNKIIAAGVLQGMRDGTNSFASSSIVRIHPGGTVDTSFQTGGTAPWPSGGFNYIEDLTVAPDDKIYCVGGFGAIYEPDDENPTTRYGIARLNADGSLDTGFQLTPADFGVPADATNPRGFFGQAVLDPSGRIYVAGSFEWGPSYPNSESIQVFARLNSDGSRDLTFNPVLPATVTRVDGIALEPNGDLTVLGQYGDSATNSWMERFTPTGASAPFSLDATLGVLAARPLQRDPNGRFLLATGASPDTSRDTLIRLNNDGSIDSSFSASATFVAGPKGAGPGFFNSFTTSPSGKIYSGSFFDTVGGVSTKKLVAFEGDAVADAPGSIQFAAHAFSVNEEDGTILIPITRTGGTTGAASADFSMSDITTTAASDYTEISTTVSFAAGTGGTQYVSIPIASDSSVETVEIASLSLTGITGAISGSTTSANLAIVDSDSPPEIVLQPQTLFIPPFDSFILSVGVLSGSSPTTFQWKRGSSEIPGATSPVYFVSGADPSLHDGDYSVVVTNPNGTVTSANATVTVKNPAILDFTASGYSGVENAGTGTLTLRRTGSSIGAVSVDVSFSGGEATSPADFDAAPITVSWADGDSADKTVEVPLVDDEDTEASETFSAQLTNFSPDSAAGSIDRTSFSILDDDSGAVITEPVAAIRAVLGWAATLTVGIESQTPATHQWFKDGLLLEGATEPTLTIAPIGSDDFGLYSVEITNTAGTVTSGPAELGERPNPIELQPFEGINSNGITYQVISSRSGGYYIPGSFSQWSTPDGNVSIERLARIFADGSLDTSFTLTINSSISEVTELDDGSLLIRGGFTAVDGITVDRFAKLLPNGSLDTDFMDTIGSDYPTVTKAFVDDDGRIILYYDNGTSIARLAPDGTADPSFASNATAIFTSANYSGFHDSDYGYYLSGTLNMVGLPAGQTRRNLLRLNEDGTIDDTFTPVSEGFVFDVQSDGRVISLSGGYRVRRLKLDGSVDPTFTELRSVFNSAFAVGSDDSIYASIRNLTSGEVYELRHYLPDGSLDLGFNAGDPLVTTSTRTQYSDITAISRLENGQLFLDGAFLTFNGASVPYRPVIINAELESIAITSLSGLTVADPGEDATLRVVASSAFPLAYQWRKNGNDLPGEDSPLLLLSDVVAADTADYSVFVSSSTDDLASDSIPFIVRDAPVVLSGPSDETMLVGNPLELTVDYVALEPATIQWYSGDDPIDGATSATYSVASPDSSNSGKYTATITNNLGTATSDPAIIDIIPDPAGLVAGFIPATSGFNSVNQITAEPNGGAYLYGNFSITHPSGSFNSSFERIDSNGNIAEPFTISANQSISEMARDSSGNLLLVGSNFYLNGAGSQRVARIGADGTTDTTFSTNAATALSNRYPSAVAIDSADRVYLAGNNFLLRLLEGGTLDEEFNAVPSGSIHTLLPAPDNKILALTNTTVFRFNENGSPDESFTFDPSIPNTANFLDLALREDGKLMLASAGANGQAIYQLSSSGSLEASIPVDYSTYSQVSAFAVQSNGKLVFTHYHAPRISRLLPDGTPDPLFQPGDGFNSTARSLELTEEGNIWVGGQFSQFQGSTAYGFVKINGDPVDILIASQPENLLVDVGTAAQFTISASGLSSAPLSYQWRRNGVPLSDAGDVSGTSTATLSIANVEDADEDSYDVILTNLTTGRSRASSPATLVVLAEPELVAISSGQDLEVGDELTITIEAQGAGSLSYQWFRNGDPIADATAPTFSLPTAEVENSGSYHVVVTNSIDSLTSEPITVSVVLSPAALVAGMPELAFGSTVNCFLNLPDGRTLVGGGFRNVTENGTYRAIDELALVNADGSLDIDFDLSPNSDILAMALMPDGGVLVAGTFSSIGGQSRSRIARLKPDLSIDTTWTAGTGANNTIYHLEPTTDGRFYVSGQFSAFNGDSTRGYMCRINSDGTLDTGFTTPTLSTTYKARSTSDGGVVIAGAFTLGNNRYIARLNRDGSHDSSFSATATSFLYELVRLPGGDWLAGGRYGRIFKYDDDGMQDTSWTTLGNQDIKAMAVEDDGQILVGGNFTSMGNQPINRLARLNANGSIDESFTTMDGANSTVEAIVLEPLGRIWIGGAFSSYRGSPLSRFATLNGDPLDLAIVGQPSEQVGEPTTTASFSVAAVGTDTLNYQWQKNGVDLTDGDDISGASTPTLSIANIEDSDENLYQVVVSHSVTNETKTSAAAALVVLGAPEIITPPKPTITEAGLAAKFSVVARGVSPLSIQWYLDGIPLSDGDTVSGSTSAELSLSSLQVADSGNVHVRITNNLGFAETEAVSLLVEKLPAGIDRSIVLPGTLNNRINAVQPLDDGSYIIGGQFSNITHTGGYIGRRYLAKFNADGSADLSFPVISGTNTYVHSVEEAPDGKIYVGGAFTSVNFNGSTVNINRIMRINSDGSQDTSFDPGIGPNSNVTLIRPLANGKVYIAGNFTSVAGEEGTRYMALLNENGSVDTNFVSRASSLIGDLGLNADGTVWVAHANNWDGKLRIVRVDGTGAAVDGFYYNGSMTSTDVLPLADGGVRSFSSSWPYAQKISATGTIENGWPVNGSANNRIYEVADLGEGRSLIAGQFSTYANTPRNAMAAIEADGSLNPDFDPGSGFGGGFPLMVKADSQGRIWCVGNLTSYRGETIPRMVVLNGFGTESEDPFEAYVASLPEGQQGEDDDPDLDGVANFLEFLFGTDAKDPGSRPAPLSAGSTATGSKLNTDHSLTLDPTKHFRVIEVEVPTELKGASVSLEAGLSLSDFGSGATAQEIGTPTDNGASETRFYLLTPAIEDAPKMFWRLRANR